MSIGNLKTDGGKGTNYPYQSKVLLGLDRIATVVGATTTEFEAQLVLDNASVVWLEVRVYNQETGAFDPPVYFPPGSSTPGAPTLPVTYITPAAPEAKTANIDRTDGAGTAYVIPLGAHSISIANVGAGVGNIDVGAGAVDVEAGVTVNFDAGAMNNTLGSITIRDNGVTEFLLIWMT
mgnify:CR=1 FL=1|tara:strand:+ start:507 stop:1040 length:534 start_codon:yes stop_codon:yes gene_type:complete